MNRIFRLAAIFVCMSTTTALADAITVPANRSVAVGGMTAGTPDCHTIGKPKMQVTSAPSHGSVSFRWATGRLNEKAGLCKGKVVHVMQIVYSPARGYRGKDHFTVGMTFPAFENGNGSSYSSSDYDITVR